MRGFSWTDGPPLLGGRQQDINIDRELPDAKSTVLVLSLVWGRFKTADLSLAEGPRSVVFAALAPEGQVINGRTM